MLYGYKTTIYKKILNIRYVSFRLLNILVIYAIYNLWITYGINLTFSKRLTYKKSDWLEGEKFDHLVIL